MVSTLILGAGINGLLSAIKLRQAGLDVTVLEQGDSGRESSWAGAGILSLLLPWSYGPDVNTLAQRGRALWPSLATTLHAASGIDPEYWRCGMLLLDPEVRDSARTWCEEYKEVMGPVPSPLRQSLPELPISDGQIFLPDVAQARNPRIMQALRTASLRAGVTIHERTAVGRLLTAGGRVIGVEAGTDRYTADSVLVAAGAWSGGLLAEWSPAPDIWPVRGQIMLFKTSPGLLPCVVYRRGHYLVPRRDGHILVGSTLEEAGFDKCTTAEARVALLDFAYTTLPALRGAEIVTQWAGLRPGSHGNLPFIGRHPELDNLYINSGHFRYGVTMAPAAAEIVLESMLGQPAGVDARPYQWHARSAD